MAGAEGRASGPLLVVGSFPPVGGPVTAATLDAVRRAVGSGTVVHTASVRPSGATDVARVSGVFAGRRLGRLHTRVEASSLLLALDIGVPGSGRTGRLGALASSLAVVSLMPALHRFDRVSLLLAADPGIPAFALRPLWSVVDEVVVVSGSEALADRLRVPGALRRVAPEPPAVRGLMPAGVTATGPAEVTPIAMPRYVAGLVARRVLGRRFPDVYHRVRVTQNQLRTAVGKIRARRSPGPV